MVTARSAFRRGLRGLDRAQFAAFAADLWDAGGRRVRHEGDRLAVDGRTVLVRPALDPATPIEGDVDAVVTTRDPPAGAVPEGIEVVGPDELFERVRYAVGDDDRDRLLRDHFEDTLARRVASPSPPPETDRPAAADQAPSDAGGAGVSEGGGRDHPVSRRSVLAGSGAFLAGVGASMAAATVSDAGDVPETGTDPGWFPIGLTDAGVADPAAVARGHVDALEATAYSITGTKTVHGADGALRASLRIGMALSADRGFLVHVAAEGPDGAVVIGEPPARGAYWSDGERYALRISNAVQELLQEYTPRGSLEEWYFWSNVVPFGGRPFTALFFYRHLFDAVPTEASRSRDDSPVAVHLVNRVDRLERPPSPFTRLDDAPVRHLRLLAGVSAAGLVRTLDIGYRGRVGDRPVDVTWTVQYDGVGETTVPRPSWVDRALGG